jgi:phosphohistidine phosphatase
LNDIFLFRIIIKIPLFLLFSIIICLKYIAMKQLHIVRHGKSSWDYPGIDDRDRPLIERGIKNALAVGTHIMEKFGMPSLIIASPAIRAIHTALLIARSSSSPCNIVKVDERLYDSYSSSIIEVIEDTDETIDNLVIVGHNPTLTEFCNLFLPDYLENLPTAGLVSFQFDIKSWTIVEKKPARTDVYFPKKD